MAMSLSLTWLCRGQLWLCSAILECVSKMPFRPDGASLRAKARISVGP
jgi:hypothetical protein